MLKKIVTALLILLGTSIGGAFVRFNAWSWEVDAIAADQRGIEYQLVVQAERDVSDKIYQLDKAKRCCPDDWTERDEDRLNELLGELEAAERDLDTFIQQDAD